MFGDDHALDLEGVIYFETLLLARTIDWLATLSIDPDSETRRGTLAVFAELQAVYELRSNRVGSYSLRPGKNHKIGKVVIIKQLD
jgi:hypothetical protein